MIFEALFLCWKYIALFILIYLYFGESEPNQVELIGPRLDSMVKKEQGTTIDFLGFKWSVALPIPCSEWPPQSRFGRAILPAASYVAALKIA
jgi:hypothetical protein